MHIYIRVLHPENEDCLSNSAVFSNLIKRTQFIKPAWFTLGIASHPKGGFYFGIDDSFISCEEIQQRLGNFGYIFVL